MKDRIYNLKQAIFLMEAVQLHPRVLELWDINEAFILDSNPKYEDMEHVGRFSYNPNTGELVIGTFKNQHAIDIGWQATSPFDEFVRGVYTGDRVMLRWYSADPLATPEEIKIDSFNAFYDTEEMLKRNGLPPGMLIDRGVSTGDIAQETGLGGAYR